MIPKAAAFANRFAGAVNYTPTASLTTPTYDASGETTEPTYRPKPSWVTATGTHLLSHNPLTGGSDEVENPSLLISNDNGATWTTPPGLTNPIAPKPTAPGQPGHNADCFLLCDPLADRLIMYWHTSSRQDDTWANGVWYSICTDPALVTWSAPAQMISGQDVRPVLEPKVTYDPTRGKYVLHVWSEITGLISYKILDSPTETVAMGSMTLCTMTLPPAFAPIWHMDIIRETSGRWIMAFCDNSTPRKGGLASSPDGVRWRVAPRPFALTNAWTSNGIYRPSIQPAATGLGYDVLTARHQTPTARLGITRNVPSTEIP